MDDLRKYLLEWQREMDPTNFNKSTGAQYHTAPSIIMPDSSDYPQDLPEGTVTMMFWINESSWLQETMKKIEIENPIIIEKPPQSKRAKHGPIIIMDDKQAYTAIPVKENYYWAAWMLTRNTPLRILFRPEKPKEIGQSRNICIIASFLPPKKDIKHNPSKTQNHRKKHSI